MGDVAQPARRAVWRRGTFVLALLGCAAVLALTADALPADGMRASDVVAAAPLAEGAGVRGEGPAPAQAAGTGAAQSPQGPAGGDEQQARTTCGGCHAFPPPDILPRHMWRDEFVRMMFIRDNRLPPLGPANAINRTIQLPADMEQALPYFTSRAPKQLPAPERWPDTAESPVKFVKRVLSLPNVQDPPSVSNVNLVDLEGDGKLDILATEMRQGLVFTGRPQVADGALAIVASIPHPSHVTRADVDGDGIQDLLVGPGRVFSVGSRQRGRHLAPRSPNRQVWRVLAGRLAPHRRREFG